MSRYTRFTRCLTLRIYVCGYFGHTWSHGYFGVCVMCLERSAGAATANCNTSVTSDWKKTKIKKQPLQTSSGILPWPHSFSSYLLACGSFVILGFDESKNQ